MGSSIMRIINYFYTLSLEDDEFFQFDCKLYINNAYQESPFIFLKRHFPLTFVCKKTYLLFRQYLPKMYYALDIALPFKPRGPLTKNQLIKRLTPREYPS